MNTSAPFQPQGWNPRRGSALAVTLMMVTLLAMLGAGVIQLGAATLGKQAVNLARTRALYIAEAGLSEAYLAVAQGRSGAIGSPEEPAAFGGGVFWVEATPSGASEVALECHALYDSGRFSLGATLERRVHALGELGLSARGDIRIGSRATVSGVQSDSAPGGGTMDSKVERPLEESAAPAPIAQLFTNGDIYIDDGAHVDGDLHYGTGGILFANPTAAVTGTSQPQQREREMLRVPYPDMDRIPKQTRIGMVSATLGSGVHALGDVVIRSRVTLTLTGPCVILADSLELQSGGALQFDSTDGAIEFHVMNDVQLPRGSVLDSAPGQAASVGLFFHTAAGTLRRAALPVDSGGVFHGILYAPERHLVLGSQLSVTGAIHAGSIELSPDSSFVHDQSTRNSAVGVPALPRQLAWYVLPLPDEPIVRQRFSPGSFLTRNGQTTVRSASAAQERKIVIDYIDNTGLPQSYSGDPELLDWTHVSGVSDLAWVRASDSTVQAYDDGIGLFAAIVDEDLVPAPVTPGGGIRSSIQAGIDLWPVTERDFYDATSPKAPYTLDEIAAVQGMVPVPTAALLAAIELAHVDAGGTPW